MILSVIINETKHTVEKTDETILSLSNTILNLMLMNNEIIKMNQQAQSIMFSYAHEYVLGRIYDDLKIYTKNRTTINLDGYATFRTKQYKEEIETFFSNLLKTMIVKKHYDEFIADMKLYVLENKSREEKIYLKYINENYELYDENHKSLTNDARLRYLYEFGMEEEKRTDFILHYLLDVLPAKIVLSPVHICSSSNFLKTIQLIFGERVVCVQ